jgi:deoxyribose-phosphate aldolase
MSLERQLPPDHPGGFGPTPSATEPLLAFVQIDGIRLLALCLKQKYGIWLLSYLCREFTIEEDWVQDQSLAPFIDQTLLKPDASTTQILKLCEDARAHHFFGVCVNSSFIELVAKELQSTDVKPVAVVGFPLGAMLSIGKAFEAEQCVRLGAQEIDMVLSIGRLKESNFAFVRADIQAVVKASQGALVKVIIETSLLNEEEKKTACLLSVEAGAHFVKTSSGFNGGGATVPDIQLMRAAVGPKIGVKASGGVKTLEQAWALIQAGATRLGTSSGLELVRGQEIKGGY